MFKKTIILPIFALAALLSASKVEAAKLYIEPPTGNYEQGKQFQSRIMLDTQGQATAGTDVYLKFDPAVLQAVSIQKGDIYNDYLGRNIDNAGGNISYSGIISLDDDVGFNGKGLFATIVFEGVSLGTSSVSFDFTPGDKNDSNVAVLNSSNDNLTSATGATYTIVESSGGEGGGNIGGPDSPTATPSELPKSGSISSTIKGVAVGAGALVLSLFLLF